MKIRHRLILMLILAAMPALLEAQLNGYLSSTYGFDNNPLANNLNASDQISQTFLQLKYDFDEWSQPLHLGYTGAATLFNQLQERTYYEHTVTASYEIIGGTDSLTDADSSGRYFDISGQYTSRYDKAFAQEFDNSSIAISPSYKYTAGQAFAVAIEGRLSNRMYRYVEALSNITEWATLNVGNSRANSLRYGGLLSGGLKQYTNNIFDTARFVIQSNPGGGNGKGKGNGNSGNGGVGAAKKKTLLEPQGRSTAQIAAGAYCTKKWDKVSVGVTILYRVNPLWVTRYLVHMPSTSILSEDIYNDFFSYEGFEGQLNARSPLPFGCSGTLAIIQQQKKFGAPALTLDEIQSAPSREDRRTTLELSVSRPISMGEIFTLDLTTTFGFVRNSSNDEYNDFSGYTVSFAAGIGF